MPFGDITSQTIVYKPRSPGIYTKDGVLFSDPQNEYRMRGGAVRKDGTLSAGVTRFIEKDVTIGSSTERKQAVVSLSITIPRGAGFTPTEIDSLATDIANFISADTASRLIQGEV